MKIKAAVTYAPGAPFQIEEVELAPPQKHEILVKITACGVCHTDDAARNQVIPVPLPCSAMRAVESLRRSALKSVSSRWGIRSASRSDSAATAITA